MCYKIVSHSLVCDVRSLLSDGREVFVDTFRDPLECDCKVQREMKSWFRCDKHKCCMVSAKMIRCPPQDECNLTIYLQRYEQASFQRKKVWMEAQNVDEYMFPKGLPVLHYVTEDFEEAVNATLSLGKTIWDAGVTLVEAYEGVKKVRREHKHRHPWCPKYLKEWQCGDVRDMVVAGAVMFAYMLLLVKHIDLFQARLMCFQFDWKKETDMVEVLRLIIYDTAKALEELPPMSALDELLTNMRFELRSEGPLEVQA
ncbi:hypothetical protein AK830_g11011 [Neonectria ditissima]|uniref:Uncharacterized protein n=1 Tax=Neonectria ditissima TaxID=78410 RepID=A0A0N8H595_9HYPO|nr:hypothetical protein AK830_g11011 [Neonectria ditissima]